MDEYNFIALDCRLLGKPELFVVRCGNNLYCSKVMYPILSLNYVIGVAVAVRLKPKDKVREET